MRPRLSEQSLAWFEAHLRSVLARQVSIWIFDALAGDDDIEGTPLEDLHGRAVTVSRVPETDVMVSWTLKPSGQIYVARIEEIRSHS